MSLKEKPEPKPERLKNFIRHHWQRIVIVISVLLPVFLYIIPLIPSYVDLWWKLKPEVTGEIHELVFAKIVPKKNLSFEHNHVGIAYITLVNNSAIPIAIKQVSYSLKVNKKDVDVVSAIPDPNVNDLELDFGADRLMIGWRDDILIRQLHNNSLMPGQPQRGRVSFVARLDPSLLENIKNNKHVLEIIFKSFTGDAYRIVTQESHFTNGVVKADILFYTDDGYLGKRSDEK